MKLYFF